MAVKTYTHECESSVSAERVFKALCIDSRNLLPKILPDSFNSIEFVQGDSLAPGSVTLIKYVAGGESKCVKHKIEEVDVEKFYFKYTVIEGEMIGEKVEFIVVEEKIEAKGTGSVARITSHFHTKGDGELEEEKLKFGKEQLINTFKVVEEYLQANPDVYA